MQTTSKQTKRARRHKRIRSRISGTASRPRLSIFKSNTMIYAQLIDDVSGKTLGSAKGKDATKVGTDVATAAKTSKVSAVIFDRGGYLYTGKVRALADAARAAGLKF